MQGLVASLRVNIPMGGILPLPSLEFAINLMNTVGCAGLLSGQCTWLSAKATISQVGGVQDFYLLGSHDQFSGPLYPQRVVPPCGRSHPSTLER